MCVPQLHVQAFVPSLSFVEFGLTALFWGIKVAPTDRRKSCRLPDLWRHYRNMFLCWERTNPNWWHNNRQRIPKRPRTIFEVSFVQLLPANAQYLTNLHLLHHFMFISFCKFFQKVILNYIGEDWKRNYCALANLEIQEGMDCWNTYRDDIRHTLGYAIPCPRDDNFQQLVGWSKWPSSAPSVLCSHYPTVQKDTPPSAEFETAYKLSSQYLSR